MFFQNHEKQEYVGKNKDNGHNYIAQGLAGLGRGDLGKSRVCDLGLGLRAKGAWKTSIIQNPHFEDYTVVSLGKAWSREVLY